MNNSQTEKTEKTETLLAVYGSLKKGFGNHRFLKHPDVTFLGETLTKEKFDMYSFGAYPALVENGEQNIVVEVYKTSNKNVLESIDSLEGFREKDHPSNFYDKIEINTEFGKAYTYVIKNISVYNCKKLITNNWNYGN